MLTPISDLPNLIKYPDKIITLPPQYFGSVNYYAAMAAFGKVIIDNSAYFDKRKKSVHRCTIADTHGTLQLTVPISKPTEKVAGKLRWSDIAVSAHGRWWQSVSESIASAYGRTPFYEFLIDRFSRFFDETTVSSFNSVASLDEALNRVICDFLGIEGDIVYNDASEAYNIEPKTLHLENITFGEEAKYYQVREQRFGFIDGLSILDLIFNMGPEAPLLLLEKIKRMTLA